MDLTVDLQVVSEDEDRPPPASFHSWVSAAIGNRLQEAELTIRIVDEAEITQLNADYRDKNTATNILSFPADLPEHIELPLLGDLVICASVIEQEAHEQHKNIQDHWAHIVIHGTLHLLGYDHIEDVDAATMEALEIELLSNFNISNPYLLSNITPTTPQEGSTKSYDR
jgi:probable rRNA maturation factor